MGGDEDRTVGKPGDRPGTLGVIGRGVRVGGKEDWLRDFQVRGLEVG